MWKIIMYGRENGKIPVRDFLDSLAPEIHAKALHDIKILEKYGINLTMPYAKHITGKLWELRIKFAGDISRIFYFIPYGKNIILLRGFIKKTNKTPANEIRVAIEYMNDYLRRFPE